VRIGIACGGSTDEKLEGIAERLDRIEKALLYQASGDGRGS
jgi:hypothetical protein